MVSHYHHHHCMYTFVIHREHTYTLEQTHIHKSVHCVTLMLHIFMYSYVVVQHMG